MITFDKANADFKHQTEMLSLIQRSTKTLNTKDGVDVSVFTDNNNYLGENKCYHSLICYG